MMQASEEQIIKGLKVKYDGKTYDQVTYLSVDGWAGTTGNNVSFTNAETNGATTNIRCKLQDIKIIIEKDE